MHAPRAALILRARCFSGGPARMRAPPAHRVAITAPASACAETRDAFREKCGVGHSPGAAARRSSARFR
ncbi:hypothetical protein WG70_28105 [Burkholderia oklahomensis EO147]|nr:hypothetical protein WG70_28105 [Burkholderia oklahomensis EO147]KUY64710.1 hypothetical protein WG70_29395 [Burkholderia oklahomensis EO147]